jgi:hypothetical protein
MNLCSCILNMIHSHNVEKYQKYLRNRFALDLFIHKCRLPLFVLLFSSLQRN